MSQHRAIKAYRSGDVSTNEAAKIAGVSIGKWLEITGEEGLTCQFSTDDLEKTWKPPGNYELRNPQGESR